MNAIKSINLSRCALFAALTALCAWLSLPLGSITFTLQSFSTSLCLLLLGGKWGTVTMLVYLLLGATGLPVFSGFRGGIGMLLGPTGGFLAGFLAMALLYWILTFLFREKSRLLALILGQLLCYIFGATWFHFSTGSGILSSLMLCVVPYLLPDGAKLVMAWQLAKYFQHRI